MSGLGSIASIYWIKVRHCGVYNPTGVSGDVCSRFLSRSWGYMRVNAKRCSGV
jgi:hypothetical protein